MHFDALEYAYYMHFDYNYYKFNNTCIQITKYSINKYSKISEILTYYIL